MTKIDISMPTDAAATEEAQLWLPPEAPLEMPRQALAPAREGRSPVAPLLGLRLLRTRA